MSQRFSLFILLFSALPVLGQTPQQVEFFEKSIRPLLVAQCVECHGADAKKIKGKLLITSRADLLRGGETGAAIVPGEPAKSLLLQAVRYTHEVLKMPPKGKLKESEIANLETWIKNGAVWPETTNTTKEPSKTGPLFTDAQKNFWAFQPMREPTIPKNGSRTPLDALIAAKYAEMKVRPMEPASRGSSRPRGPRWHRAPPAGSASCSSVQRRTP